MGNGLNAVFNGVWKHSRNPLVPALARVIVTLHMHVDAFSADLEIRISEVT